MPSWLGAWVALSEGPSLSPSTHKVAHNHLKLQTMGLALFSGLREPQTWCPDIRVGKNTHTYKVNNKFFSKRGSGVQGHSQPVSKSEASLDYMKPFLSQ